jgi:hypothetical protein
VIVGKALYEGRFTIPEGREALEPEREGERPFRVAYDASRDD